MELILKIKHLTEYPNAAEDKFKNSNKYTAGSQFNTLNYKRSNLWRLAISTYEGATSGNI